MRHAVHHLSTFLGWSASSQGACTTGAPRTRRSAPCSGGARLPRAAQETGQVREDVTADELFGLLSGAAWVREKARSGPRRQPPLRTDGPGGDRRPPGRGAARGAREGGSVPGRVRRFAPRPVGAPIRSPPRRAP
ncbi:hypothetical protein C5F59_001055 [Streptomyces sp. QL37]|uniref:SbtR family transcriptional regulator n=1 Tax=Streptomyces sp. QL37 TaxID=2093747 RepID=UPI0035C178C5